MSESKKPSGGRSRAIIAGPVVAVAVALGLTVFNGSGPLRTVEIVAIAAAAALVVVTAIRLASRRR